jgi:hypothetical protein
MALPVSKPLNSLPPCLRYTNPNVTWFAHPYIALIAATAVNDVHSVPFPSLRQLYRTARLAR